MNSEPGWRALCSGITGANLVRVGSSGRESVADQVAVEEPLEIRIAGETLAITMRTPGSDVELVAGLLLSEGLIGSRADLDSLSHCGRPDQEGYGNVIEVTPASGSALDRRELVASRRATLISAACGVCGRTSIDDLLARLPARSDPTCFEGAFLAELVVQLSEHQRNFARTGGLHAAAVADRVRGLTLVREDVGRHNAVDKVLGRRLLDEELPAHAAVLVVSGRASFELVQKAVVAGFSALVSVSAPSSLAIATALRCNLTLLGFVRGGTYNIYSGAERVL